MLGVSDSYLWTLLALLMSVTIFEGYDITIAGEPDLHIAWTQRFGDRAGVNRTSNYLEGALVATAMAAVNAIPVVCAARPGLRTFVDLPLITASGRVWPPRAPAALT